MATNDLMMTPDRHLGFVEAETDQVVVLRFANSGAQGKYPRAIPLLPVLRAADVEQLHQEADRVQRELEQARIDAANAAKAAQREG